MIAIAISGDDLSDAPVKAGGADRAIAVDQVSDSAADYQVAVIAARAIKGVVCTRISTNP